eukprot:8222465-Pyramimonas_sp.AAC.1
MAKSIPAYGTICNTFATPSAQHLSHYLPIPITGAFLLKGADYSRGSRGGPKGVSRGSRGDLSVKSRRP